MSGCEGCIRMPETGEPYPEPCETCRRWYPDNWTDGSDGLCDACNSDLERLRQDRIARRKLLGEAS